MVSKASYTDISNVTLKVVSGDNSKPTFAAYIVTASGDVEVFAAIGSKAGFGTGGTNKWGSKSTDLATAKTGKLKIITYAESSGKYAAIDDIIITYGGGGCTSHSVNLSGSGSVTGGTFATSSATVCEDGTATLTATPAAGYVFTSWSASGTGSSLSSTTTNPTTLTMGTADVSVNATFTKVYASGTYTFYGNTTVGSSPSKTVTTTATDYDAFRIDNLFFSSTNIQYESGSGSTESNDYYGWKVKKSSTIKFFVEDDSDVKICIGTIGGGTCTVSYTDHSSVAHNNTSISSGSHETYEVKGGTMVTLSMAPSSTKSVTLKQIMITPSVSCTAPTSPSISGTTTYTAGGTISLTASASGTNASTTYQWYKGNPENGGVSQGDASTSGATFSKSAVVADEGTYYCVISNGEGCTVTTNQAITVSCATAPSAVSSLTCSAKTTTSLTYTWTKASNASGYTATLYSDSDCKTQVSTSSLGDVNTVTFSTLSVGTTYYCKVQSKGNGTVYCVDGGTTSAVSGTTLYQYAISYNAGTNGTGSISGGTKTEGTAFTLSSSKFTRDGYTQTGWTTSDGGAQTHALGGSYTIDAAQTFYPVWTANTISLTLDKNNNDASGSTSGSASVKYNATALESGTTHATRTGYSIEGYYAEVGCTNKVLTNVGALVNYSGYVSGGKWARTTTPTTLYAKWTLNSYLLTWNLNGGTVTEAGTGAAVDATGSPSSSVSYGAEITAPTVEKEGYTFTGWNADVASTMPAVATTYTAQWTINQYTVTWKSNGATVRTDNNVNHGTAQTPPTISPLPCGDKLMGWTDAVDGAYVHGTSTLYTTATITITGNKTFYAVFADYGE